MFSKKLIYKYGIIKNSSGVQENTMMQQNSIQSQQNLRAKETHNRNQIQRQSAPHKKTIIEHVLKPGNRSV